MVKAQANKKEVELLYRIVEKAQVNGLNEARALVRLGFMLQDILEHDSPLELPAQEAEYLVYLIDKTPIQGVETMGIVIRIAQELYTQIQEAKKQQEKQEAGDSGEQPQQAKGKEV